SYVRDIIVGICLFFVLFVYMPAQAALPNIALPAVIPDSEWEPLREAVDADLQKRLEVGLNKNKAWMGLIKRKQMAIGVVDLTDPAKPRFARVNGQSMMYAASLPKIAVLLAAFVAIEKGNLKETPEVIKDMNLMIRKSSNTAATRMIDRAGGIDSVNAVMMDPRYELYDPELGGGLWVGKRYAKAGAVHRDPLKQISHGASVTQVCRFYYLLATGRLINPKRSLDMLNIMSDPGIHHKFVHALEEVAPNATLYRKSGTWRRWHADSVLVWGKKWRRYILVGMVEDDRGGVILENVVKTVEEALGH
ncbi:MAG: beta-lactamase class A, partial [Candidatus Latescibacterota bacterium]